MSSSKFTHSFVRVFSSPLCEWSEKSEIKTALNRAGSALLETLDVAIVPLEVRETWKLPQCALEPVFTRSGIQLSADMTTATLHPGLYVALMAATAELNKSEAESLLRLDAARCDLAAMFGEHSVFKLRAQFACEHASGKLTFASNSFRTPSDESAIAVYPNAELYTGEQRLSAIKTDESVQRAVRYFNRAIDEQDWTLKMFFYLLAIETAGSGNDLAGSITKIYVPPFKTQHLAKQALRVTELKKIRDDFAHNATEAKIDTQLERLAQLITLDLIEHRATDTHNALAITFLDTMNNLRTAASQATSTHPQHVEGDNL